ncbi:MAG: EamA family transporter [Candidatus Omnitrophica bacterium]|nr:EamA family transporter [Candidatus Omnitrophota bacterium]
MIKILCLVVLAELFSSLMHVLFKKSVNSLSHLHPQGVKGYLVFFKAVLQLPSTWLGLLSVAVGMTIWMTVLAQVDLSVAFPLDSIQYIMILAASHFIFKEHITPKRIFGTGLILAGIMIVLLSQG